MTDREAMKMALDIDPDLVLKNAIGKLDCVVIAGCGKDGKEWFAASMGDNADALWYLERFKKRLLELGDTHD